MDLQPKQKALNAIFNDLGRQAAEMDRLQKLYKLSVTDGPHKMSYRQWMEVKSYLLGTGVNPPVENGGKG